jgi:hypothetical protein
MCVTVSLWVLEAISTCSPMQETICSSNQFFCLICHLFTFFGKNLGFEKDKVVCSDLQRRCVSFGSQLEQSVLVSRLSVSASKRIVWMVVFVFSIDAQVCCCWRSRRISFYLGRSNGSGGKAAWCRKQRHHLCCRVEPQRTTTRHYRSQIQMHILGMKETFSFLTASTSLVSDQARADYGVHIAGEWRGTDS